MIEIFRLARLPHVEVRACCALLVAGGWSVVINVQTVGLFNCSPMCPAVQPPLLSIISIFGIIMQNDRFALQTVSRSAGGGGGQTRADPATFGPCPLLFTIFSNIKHSTFYARAVNEPSRSLTEKASNILITVTVSICEIETHARRSQPTGGLVLAKIFKAARVNYEFHVFLQCSNPKYKNLSKVC